MKTIKFFIILGMILGAIFIVPLIVGFLALKRLDTSTTTKELLPISICVLIFCSLIGGILMLNLTDDDLCKYILSPNEQKLVDAIIDTMDDDDFDDESNKSIIKKMKDLKELYEEGVINDKSYCEKINKYISLL